MIQSRSYPLILNLLTGKSNILLLLIACYLTQQATYSEPLSARLAYLSRVIYQIDEKNLNNQCPLCYSNFTCLNQVLGNHILGMVGVDKHLSLIIVVFRGSDNVFNGVTDINMIPSYFGNSDCKQCEVHSGFYNSYKTLVEEKMEKYIIAAVKNHPDYPVVFTGHSLGGALANLFAINFRQKKPSKYVKLYTFGQPRVGNEFYAKFITNRISEYFRVVHQKDIVPHKPKFLSYRHSGIQIWYNESIFGPYLTCESESQSCSNQLGKTNDKFWVSDHYSNKYIRIYEKFFGPDDKDLVKFIKFLKDAGKYKNFEDKIVVRDVWEDVMRFIERITDQS